MPTPEDIAAYRYIQDIARSVLADLAACIGPDDSEHSIESKARQMLMERGISSTWYYDCPALVLAGSRSCLSISGRNYIPSKEPVGSQNLITIDLSPACGSIWGDCAQSFFMEDGQIVCVPSAPEFHAGKHLMEFLHAQMMAFVCPATRFSDLFRFSNDNIEVAGFRNLDFLCNVGHSIAMRLEDRLFIDANTNHPLCSVPFFAFEPHVCQKGGCWGFKCEHIYYFNSQGMIEAL